MSLLCQIQSLSLTSHVHRSSKLKIEVQRGASSTMTLAMMELSMETMVTQRTPSPIWPVRISYAPFRNSYPFGPARNPTSYERGSVQYISIYPGDPTTPGYPAYMNSKRSDPENVPKIPSLPISWSNAQRLLQEIEKGGENRTVRLVNRGEF